MLLLTKLKYLLQAQSPTLIVLILACLACLAVFSFALAALFILREEEVLTPSVRETLRPRDPYHFGTQVSLVAEGPSPLMTTPVIAIEKKEDELEKDSGFIRVQPLAEIKKSVSVEPSEQLLELSNFQKKINEQLPEETMQEAPALSLIEGGISFDAKKQQKAPRLSRVVKRKQTAHYLEHFKTILTDGERRLRSLELVMHTHLSAANENTHSTILSTRKILRAIKERIAQVEVLRAIDSLEGDESAFILCTQKLPLKNNSLNAVFGELELEPLAFNEISNSLNELLLSTERSFKVMARG